MTKLSNLYIRDKQISIDFSGINSALDIKFKVKAINIFIRINKNNL